MTAAADLTDPLAIDESALIELAARLVRIRTVNDPAVGAVEGPAAELVAGVMRGFGWAVTTTEIAPGRTNVIGVVEGTARADGAPMVPAGARTLMFEGHLDVVTEGDPAAWSFDPFAGDVVDGRLRGRGSADMKSGVAAMIHAARAVQLAGFAGRLVVAVLADEEGMMLGAKRFAADLIGGRVPGVDRVDGVIVAEPEGGEVCPVAKGAMRLVITLTGAMAHGAMPDHGRNPLPAIGSVLIGLSELERGMRLRHPPHPLLGQVWVTPTVLAAGALEQINVIPATALLAVDVRTVPGIDHGQLAAVVEALATSVAAGAGVDAVVTVLDDRPPVDTPLDDPVVRAMLAGHRAATGRDAVIGGVPGTTDGTILSRDAGLPTVVYGPGDKWIAHQADEVVAVRDVVIAARAFAAAAVHFLSASSPSGRRPG